ncbi:MAG: translation initiation factor IF-2 subunit beta [Nanoarchaeota archaeon]|nr:translation initiation factor IF-2 subunit beta [Nanoarchaeota archaeon]
MSGKDYLAMLDDARKHLPERVFEKSRFEIPRTQSFIEGKKTVFTNFGKIASYISRDESHFCKFLTKELGTGGVMESGKLVLVGKFSNFLLNEKVNKYIKAFVTCKECGKQDTLLSKEDRVWFLKCEACGAKRPVINV